MHFILGPCVIESELHALGVARRLASLGRKLGVELTYKSSFDKANRSSASSPRGPGLEDGLAILAEVKGECGLPILTDVHECAQVDRVAEVADIIQIPAFLCRQTDLLQAAIATGKQVLVKKGQFMSPAEMAGVVEKARSAAPGGYLPEHGLLLCERGTSFGYNELVVDMRGLAQMAELGHPVVFDCTHSVQRPGANGKTSGGDREMVPVLARAAAAVGVDAMFIETHPDPARAHSDAATAWPLDRLESLMLEILAIDAVRQGKALASIPAQ